MQTAQSDSKNKCANKKEGAKSSQSWGMTPEEFYRALQEKRVRVTTLDAKTYAGTLVGLSPYDLIITQANGLTALIPKHAVKIVHIDNLTDGSK